METASVWRELFKRWPAGLAYKGVVVSSFNEQIPFENFLFNEQAVVLERNAPDAVGGRKVVLPYSSIQAVKIIDPVKPQVWVAAGYINPAAQANRKPTAGPATSVPPRGAPVTPSPGTATPTPTKT